MEDTLKAARFVHRVLVATCLALLGAVATFHWRKPPAGPAQPDEPWFNLSVDCMAFKAPMVAIHYVGVLAVAIMVCMIAGHMHHLHFLRNKDLIGEPEKRQLLTFPWSPLYPGRMQRMLTAALFLVLPLGTVGALTYVAWLHQTKVTGYGEVVFVLLVVLVALAWLTRTLRQAKELVNALSPKGAQRS